MRSSLSGTRSKRLKRRMAAWAGVLRSASMPILSIGTMMPIIANMGDQKALKDSITAVYRKYTGPLKKSDLDTDMQKDYNRQRDYLEKSVDSLKKKLEKDSQEIGRAHV